MLLTERFLQAFDNLFVKDPKGRLPEVPGHVFPPISFAMLYKGRLGINERIGD